jgi:hypothetical protein
MSDRSLDNANSCAPLVEQSRASAQKPPVKTLERRFPLERR